MGPSCALDDHNMAGEITTWGPQSSTNERFLTWRMKDGTELTKCRYS